MSVLRLGATKQYSDNWEKIFSGGRSPSKNSTAKPAKKSPKKGAKKAAKPAGKKRAAGKKAKKR